MPGKYHVHTRPSPPRFKPVGKYATVQFQEECAGSCRECVKKNCIYGIFKENDLHISAMKEPEYLYICQSCLRCIQECTKGAFSLVINPEYQALGDDYWTADIISSTWFQAHTGRIPISGAGYRGPFVGKGFDSMWTDMSEIVRPTRDGIHGREYINTSIDVSRKPLRLQFGKDASLISAVPPILELPLPLMFQQPDFGILTESVLLAMVAAAHELGTMMFIEPENIHDSMLPFADKLIPCLTGDNYQSHAELVRRCRMVELAYRPGIEEEFAGLRSLNPGLFISVGIRLNAEAATRALELAQADVDTLHFFAGSSGGELDTEEPRFLKELIREVHLKLVDSSIRPKVNLVFSGGIAMAEHMAKAIICGADGVAVDYPLLIAMECRLCHGCRQGKPCPVRLEDIDFKNGSQRIINLISAWRNQLIEVMGAMGIRDVKRLRGEIGRSMWFEELERDSFAPIFGERKVQGIE